MPTIKSAEEEGRIPTVSDGSLHNTSLNGPVATYYDKRHQKGGQKKKGGLPGGNAMLQHSISFETIYPKESKLPARGGVLRNSQRKKRTKNYSSGHGSSSDDSNTSFDQPTTGRVSMDPGGRSNRRSNISQVSSNISSGDSYTMSPNTSTDGTGITNTGYEANLSSLSSAEEYSFDTSQEGSGEKRNVTFAKGVPVENYKGKPKRSKKAKTPNTVLAMKLAAKTPPPKYRQTKTGKENGAVPIQGQSGFVRRNSSRSRRRSSGRRRNSDGRHSDGGRSSDGGRAPPSPKFKPNEGHANPTYVPDSPVTSDVPKSPQMSNPERISTQTSSQPPQTSPQNHKTSPSVANSDKTSPFSGQNLQTEQEAATEVDHQNMVYPTGDQQLQQQQQYMDYQQQMQYAAYMQQYYQDPQYAQQMVPQPETYQPMQYVDPNYYQQAYQQYYDPNNQAVSQNTTDNSSVTTTSNVVQQNNVQNNIPTKSTVQYQTDPNQNVHNQSTVLNSSVETSV